MEHPRNPSQYKKDKNHSASIWRAAVIRWFLQTTWFFLQNVSQGHSGAPSPKPTTFLIAGIDEVEATELERRFAMPKTVSIGREGNAWKTGKLKEHPTELCTYFAALFSRWLSTSADKKVRTFDETAEWLQDLVGKDGETITQFGPDFAFYSPNLQLGDALHGTARIERVERERTIVISAIHQARSTPHEKKIDVCNPFWPPSCFVSPDTPRLY